MYAHFLDVTRNSQARSPSIDTRKIATNSAASLVEHTSTQLWQETNTNRRVQDTRARIVKKEDHAMSVGVTRQLVISTTFGRTNQRP